MVYSQKVGLFRGMLDSFAELFGYSSAATMESCIRGAEDAAYKRASESQSAPVMVSAVKTNQFDKPYRYFVSYMYQGCTPCTGHGHTLVGLDQPMSGSEDFNRLVDLISKSNNNAKVVVLSFQRLEDAGEQGAE
ncbi:MAG: hypothetical protein PHV02_03305 [Rhodocyclaceae bacterium]|nr:hypothetical protein [Rhodocyclaceae bacterium]